MPLLTLPRLPLAQNSRAQKGAFAVMLLVFASLCMVLALPTSASANQGERMLKLASLTGEHGGDIGRAQAIAIAKQGGGGKVLKVMLRKGHYAVKLLTPKGRVKVVKVDRASGALLKRKPRVMAADAPLAPR